MSTKTAETGLEPVMTLEKPDVSHLVTEDDEPVDNIFSAKQQRLLVEPLYSSWQIDRLFLADANVGVFRDVYNPPVVPDMFLSMDVQVAEEWHKKEHRSYFLWEFGKPPEAVVEIVSNTKGGELDRKLALYEKLLASYYVIFDPFQQIQDELVVVYELVRRHLVIQDDLILADLDLSLRLWEGSFEGKTTVWLRWCDLEGNLILTGAERAELEYNRAELEYNRAEQEHNRAKRAQLLAEQQRERAERLAARLRELGVDPNSV